MKKIIFTLLIFLHLHTTLSQNIISENLEIVESIPVETNLDNPEIKNTYDVWIQMIKEATSSLDIEQFYISNKKGELFENIIQEIIKASQRGVNVRVIVDAKMYKTYPETVDILNQQKNIKVHTIDFNKLAGGIQHSKFFIIDKNEIFLGSQNFDWRALTHIHEIGIRIKHKELVQVYEDIFNLDWQLAETGNDLSLLKTINSKKYSIPFILKNSDTTEIFLTPTMSPKKLILDSTLWDEYQIIRLIDNAKQEILCQFLTYSPVERNNDYFAVLDNALRRAAVRGVKVNMIVSDWSLNHPTIDHLKSLSLIPNIQIKCSSIPDWSGGYIPYARVEHCKYLVVDSIGCWIGTSNWEKSYFYTSRNIGVIIQNTFISNKMREIFYKSWDGKYTQLIKPDVSYKTRRHND